MVGRRSQEESGQRITDLSLWEMMMLMASTTIYNVATMTCEACSLSSIHTRILYGNQLTALGMALLDKNTALAYLYVDQRGVQE